MKKIIIYIKKYTTSGLFVIGGFFVLLTLMTQLQPLLQNFEEHGVLSERVAEEEADLESIRQTTSSQITSQLQVVDEALPSEKNATLIYSLVTTVASMHAVSVESFSIDVGEVLVSGDDADPYSSLLVSLDISSPSHVNTLQFIEGLYQALPISEVSSVRMLEGRGQLTLVFYHSNPGEREGSIQLGSEQQQLIQELSGWHRAE